MSPWQERFAISQRACLLSMVPWDVSRDQPRAQEVKFIILASKGAAGMDASTDISCPVLWPLFTDEETEAKGRESVNRVSDQS